MARLMFYRGDDLLIDYRLRPGRTAIGRSDGSDVALPGEEISRTHCLIDGEGDRWEIVDRSRHGTRVNGRAVRRADLADGDQIEIGVFLRIAVKSSSCSARTAVRGSSARRWWW